MSQSKTKCVDESILDPRDFWNEMAEHYDEYVASTRYSFFRPEEEANFFNELFRGRHLILDLGCGTGRTMRLLCQYGYELVGVDFSKGMLRVAKRHKVGYYILSSILCLPFPDSIFDATFSLHGGLSHFKTYHEKLHICQEIARVTKSGGLVFIDQPNPYRKDKGETYIVEWSIGQKKIKTYGYAFWPRDVKSILRKSQLRLKYLLGDYKLNKRYTKESRRLIAIASKET